MDMVGIIFVAIVLNYLLCAIVMFMTVYFGFSMAAKRSPEIRQELDNSDMSLFTVAMICALTWPSASVFLIRELKRKDGK